MGDTKKKRPAHEVIMEAIRSEHGLLLDRTRYAGSGWVGLRYLTIEILLCILQRMVIPDEAEQEIMDQLEGMHDRVPEVAAAVRGLFKTAIERLSQG